MTAPAPWYARLIAWLAPGMALRRAAQRQAIRHYEAASGGRRTQGWTRSTRNADRAEGQYRPILRDHARDLVRNNSYARRAVNTIVNGVVGWGIVPRPVGDAQRASAVWQRWSESIDCATSERATFPMLQRQIVRALVIDGEVLLRRRRRRVIDGYALPLQLQILEADYLDASQDAVTGIEGGPIVQGVEHDALGRRVAYWLFDQHPGSGLAATTSRRVPAEDVIHLYDPERPEAVRGVSWLASAIVALKDLDDLEDAELMRQKIAACFAAFVTDTDGGGAPLGSVDSTGIVESLEPGMVVPLPPGREVTFGSPPQVVDGSLADRTLRRGAVGLGITYEDLTGDYSKVNFSSARMGRLAYQANVAAWQWQLVVPLLCGPVYRWAMESAVGIGAVSEEALIPSEWTVPALPMLEPDREGLALQRLVRTGVMTHTEMVRERGGDPRQHWEEYASGLAELDRLGIRLDSDVRATTQSGLEQGSQQGGGSDQ